MTIEFNLPATSACMNLNSADIDRQKWHNNIMLGNCLKVLQSMPSNLVDLVVTSPPYADSRKTTYGGIHPDN